MKFFKKRLLKKFKFCLNRLCDLNLSLLSLKQQIICWLVT
ncbi:hypothetical protein NSP_22980 [Nodularia spumigena CCY9414]|nr:hypothetical protein NSP_22980 [Nodularia spumigena CCY9414]